MVMKQTTTTTTATTTATTTTTTRTTMPSRTSSSTISYRLSGPLSFTNSMASTAVYLLSLISIATAYSFDISTAPTQCGSLSLAITQGQGVPPYSALVIPFGASPTQTEVRTVVQHNFTDAQTSFALKYPANAGFVVMMSDSTGVGTGGTSAPTTVGSSATNDSSCLPQSVSTSFSFQIIPNSAINQCQTTTLAWDSNADRTPTIYLVIPGGQSSIIPTGTLVKAQGNTTGFQWTPNVRAGTNIILVAGDNGGPGTGGSVNIAVGNGDSGCINGTSPSSTAGTPAGAVQTSPTSSQSPSGSSSNNVSAIAGGVVGGLVLVIVLVLGGLFFFRRRRQQKYHDSVDLLPEGGGGGRTDSRDTDHPPEFYQPEPYIVASVSGRTDNTHSRNVSAEDGTNYVSERPSMSVGRRYSAVSTTDHDQSESTGTMLGVAGMRSGGSTSYYTQTSRKTPAGPTLRPVNWVQHEDAGEIPEAGEGSAQQAETIEVPPSYDDIRR